MDIILISLVETIAIGLVILGVFILYLAIPVEGTSLLKEFKIDENGLCIRFERVKEKSKKNEK